MELKFHKKILKLFGIVCVLLFISSLSYAGFNNENGYGVCKKSDGWNEFDEVKLINKNNKVIFDFSLNINLSDDDIDMFVDNIDFDCKGERCFVELERNEYNKFEQGLFKVMKRYGKGSRLDRCLKVSNVSINLSDDILSDDRLSPYLTQEALPYWTLDKKGNLYLTVLCYENIDIINCSDILNLNGFEVMNELSLINGLTIKTEIDKIDDILEIEEVVWVEEMPVPGSSKLLTSKEDINIDNELYEDIGVYGEGVNILQFEDSYAGGHSDLGDRIIYQDKEDGKLRNHAIHVAGIIIGNGSVNGVLGIAPKAQIASYVLDFSWRDSVYNQLKDLEEDYLDAIEKFDVGVATNSWGMKSGIIGYCSKLGDYTTVSKTLDELVVEKSLPIVWAAGNEQNYGCGNDGYGTIMPKASSKNVITVGAVDRDLKITDFSSFGPTDDGRIKPDLVAPGYKILSTVKRDKYKKFSGTSMSAPHVTGVIALLENVYFEKYDTKIKPIASLWKAVLIDSAVDLKNDGSGEKVVDGPDFVNGYGVVDTKEAIDRIENEDYVIDYLDIYEKEKKYLVEVSSIEDLKFTLVWDDDSAKMGCENCLVNDLDMYLISPEGEKFYPWSMDEKVAVRNIKNSLDPVEQVFIFEDEVIIGDWILVVNTSQLDGYQDYSLVSRLKIEEYVETKLDNNLSEGLVAKYSFSGDSLDESGNGYDLINVNTSLCEDRFGNEDKSYCFNGFDSYLYRQGESANPLADVGHGDFTISLWAKIDEKVSRDDNVMVLLNFGFEEVQNEDSISFRYLEELNQLKVAINEDVIGMNNINIKNIFIDEWNNYVFIRNNNVMIVYLNGEEVDILDNYSNLNSNNWKNMFSIGGFVHENNMKNIDFNGSIDDIVIWNRALNESEVDYIYNLEDLSLIE